MKKYTEAKPNSKIMLLLVIASLLLWDTTPSECAPIPWELVDMTYVFDETTLNWPTQKKFEMKVTMNETTADGYWLQLEEYSSAIHAGTHMDAPCHFALGKWCVDEIPLERLAGPAAVVDITDKVAADPDATVGVEDLLEWESLSGRSLNGTIVVMRSGWGSRWGDREAYIGTSGNDTDNMHFPGMSPKAAQWLVDNRDIYGVISESLSLDRGKTKDFMAHRILLGNNIYGLENVANVEEIPIVGAFLHVMPMKIGRGSGAPTRIVAKYPKVHFKPKDGKSVTERSLREIIIFSKLQLEEYASATHVGTHMDAPCHFAMGKWCVDEIPLGRLAGPAAVVDITNKAAADPDAAVEVEDLQAWESLSGRSLNGTIVVMRSGWGRKWGDREAYIGTPDNDTDNMHFPGFSPEAAQWLVDNRDVHGVASDSLTISRGQSKDFMAHRILLGNNIYGLENVANVDEIPIVGAFVHVMPMKIGRGGGAPTRIIAMYPKVHFKPKEGKSITERSVKEVIFFSK